MPLYEYRCPRGHMVERIAPHETSMRPIECPSCGQPAERAFPLPHVPTDGVYSYAPNIGSEEAFERKNQAVKEGVKIIRARDA